MTDVLLHKGGGGGGSPIKMMGCSSESLKRNPKRYCTRISISGHGPN